MYVLQFQCRSYYIYVIPSLISDNTMSSSPIYDESYLIYLDGR